MAFIGLIVAVALFLHYKRYLQDLRPPRLPKGDCEGGFSGAVRWHEEWHKQWGEKFQRQADRRMRQTEHHTARRFQTLRKRAARMGFQLVRATDEPSQIGEASDNAAEQEILRRARRRARVEVGFYTHLMCYLGVIAFLALINIMTSGYPWFMWPTIGWGIGLFSHYMAVFGARLVRERYFEPAVAREVRRETTVIHAEKQGSIDELSASIAHEIRNPIAAAKSLVQQMGEDPTSVGNVEYAKVALDELDRVERRISHLLKFAKEEDYTFAPVNLANVVDSALTQMRAKVNTAGIQIARNYIGGPTVVADGEKLRQVFTNIIDNASDALEGVTEGRRIELFIDSNTNGAANGRAPHAVVRVRDNGAGIPADKIDRIFNPFFTTKEKGTGLGMAISKKIIEAHDGSIDVVSEQGRGTEFVVSLPLPQ